MIRILAFLISTFAMSVALAQDWPARPVRVIVNVAPGGVGDVVARLVAASLGDTLKQPFMVENRAGGEGYIGFEAVARAEPDGYTLLFSPGSSMMITPHLVRRPDFDPVDLLVPIAPAVKTTLYLVVPPSHPARNVKEFIDYARANPGKMNFGSAGTGSGLHIAGEIFKRETGIQATHVPYKGAGPALKDLLGGVFEFMFDPGVGLGQIKAGKLRLLAVTSPRRHPDFPDAPTLDESGIKDVDGGPFFGFYSPKGMSQAIMRRLNAEVASAIQSPDVRRRLEAMGLDLARMSPDQFAAYVRAQSQRYGKLLRDFAITGD